MPQTYTIRGWEGEKVTMATALAVVFCPSCNIPHGIPDEMQSRAQYWKERVTIYCPNGHSWNYTRNKNEEDRLRALIAQERDALSATQDALNAEKRQHSATKGQLTKTKRRAHAGMCPVEGCQRSFVYAGRIAKHIASAHPGYTEAQVG